MYERFTDRARKIMQLANQEAVRFKHEYIGTEHILLGLVKEGSGVAANTLKNLDVDLRRIRLEVEKILQSGPDAETMSKRIQTSRAKRVIEYSIEEARLLNHNYVGTEHILLGLLREQEGIAAQVLLNLGVKLEDVREEVINLLGPMSRQNIEWYKWEEVIEDLPADIRRPAVELNSQIDQINREKEEAVAELNFAKAADLRDLADKLNKKKKTALGNWAATHRIEPSWLSWNGGTVARIAHEINATSSWRDLPALASALEEAGCNDLEVLGHCRQLGEHAKRCWVVDLILGRL